MALQADPPASAEAKVLSGPGGQSGGSLFIRIGGIGGYDWTRRLGRHHLTSLSISFDQFCWLVGDALAIRAVCHITITHIPKPRLFLLRLPLVFLFLPYRRYLLLDQTASGITPDPAIGPVNSRSVSDLAYIEHCLALHCGWKPPRLAVWLLCITVDQITTIGVLYIFGLFLQCFIATCPNWSRRCSFATSDCQLQLHFCRFFFAALSY